VYRLDDELGSDLFLDAIVTLVDAKHITRHLDDPDCTEAAQQIAFADRVLINKKDLVSEEELDAVESRVRTINALAPAFRTVSSELDLDHILSIRAFDSARAMEVDRMANTDACQECGVSACLLCLRMRAYLHPCVPVSICIDINSVAGPAL